METTCNRVNRYSLVVSFHIDIDFELKWRLLSILFDLVSEFRRVSDDSSSFFYEMMTIFHKFDRLQEKMKTMFVDRVTMNRRHHHSLENNSIKIVNRSKENFPVK